MAKYTAAVLGGMHANYGPTIGSMDTYVAAKVKRLWTQALAHKGDFEFRALVNALIGTAPGGSANVTYPEISASVELGGARPVVNSTLVNRVTTANDVTDAKAILTSLPGKTFVVSPVPNLDRNPLGTR